MGDNICCPYFWVIPCGDSDDHSHIGCQGSLDDSLGLDNDMAIQWCLKDYENCPLRPKGE